MSQELEFPEISEAAAAPTPPATVSQRSAVAKIDLQKIDLTEVALAKFGDWRKDVSDVTAKLTGVHHDLSTQAKIDEAKSLRHRLINVPLAEARKVSKALKSKLTTVSAEVGAELVLVEAGYTGAAQLITPLIEAREAEIEAEKQRKAAEAAEAARIEAERLAAIAKAEADRKEAHEQRLATIASYTADLRGMDSERLTKGVQAMLKLLNDFEPGLWEEYAERARQVLKDGLAKVEAKRDRVKAQEDHEAEVKRQAEENARIAAENKAAADKLAADLAALAEQQAALKRQADELAAQQEAARLAALPKPAPAPEPEPEPVSQAV